jgi:glyoxylase-like metal-dependent hydrolase (beta-lactamase superfamily II)
MNGTEGGASDVRTITLSMPFGLGTVNCYLVGTGDGFVLIDTGPSNQRRELDAELARAGCQPGERELKLIVLTHGDFDHTGNAAHLRERYGAEVAMHRDDTGMAEFGDMFSNRSSGNAVMRLLSPMLLGFSKSNRFKPDVLVEEGDNLTRFGFDARVLSLPGHSKGSIGVLTDRGDLFCGDLLENTKGPAANSIMDDPVACEASLERLRGFEINAVFPGHGHPFAMEDLLPKYRMEGWHASSGSV